MQFGKPLERRPLPTGWIALGAIVLGLAAVVACGFGAVWLVGQGRDVIVRGEQRISSRMDAAGLRGETVAALTALRVACETGSCADAIAHVHPSARSRVTAQLSKLTAHVIAAADDRKASQSRVIGDGDGATAIVRLGLDPGRCVELKSSSLRVVGCETDDASAEYPFVIMDLEVR